MKTLIGKIGRRPDAPPCAASAPDILSQGRRPDALPGAASAPDILSRGRPSDALPGAASAPDVLSRGPSHVVLSPMAGYSDSPYRKLCRRMGSAMSISEFVSTEHLFRSNPKAIGLFRYEESERPVVFQIFGNDAEIVLRGVKRVLHLNPDGIDLNMGCSVRTVSGNGSGAGLLKCPDKAREIVRRLVAETGLPISAKIRLGWDHENLNYLEISEMLESEGVWAIAVHGRTRQMAYTGRADWDKIGEIAQARKIPVFGNGDVTSFTEAMHKIKTYGVHGVYVGRGAIGNPWLFAGIVRETLNYAERLPVILEHLYDMAAFYGDTAAAVLMRKHLTQYLRDLPEWNEIKRIAHHSASATELAGFLTTGRAEMRVA